MSSIARANHAHPRSPNLVGNGRVGVDFNGTPLTTIEGRAADAHLSIQNLRGQSHFDPMVQPGIALTTAQAKKLHVKVGEQVDVFDSKTGSTVRATYYDNAGKKPDGLKHFEVNPALADQLGIRYRDAQGRAHDAVFNAREVDGRFSISHIANRRDE